MARERRGEREKVVYAYLSQLDPGGKSPTNREIARAIGRNEQEVSRAVAQLERDELITVERVHVNWRRITVA